MINKKRIVCMVVLSIVIFLILIYKNQKNIIIDTIEYKGSTYSDLEYNNDIFTYYYYNVSNEFLEEDIIYPIKHNKWNMIYFNGDLYVLDNQVKSAKRYYNNDINYNWIFVLDDNEDNEVEYSIDINKTELNKLYNMDNVKKEEKILFEDIERFGSIIKVSKDNIVYGIISICYYNNNWYYKTEIMDGDYEYIIKLPDSLNKKLKKLTK